MINFDKAIQIANEKLKELQPDASFIEVEQALISEDEKQYEVTFSYTIRQADNLQLDKDGAYSNMAKLSSLLRHRKVYKTFLISADEGTFRGFKIYQSN